jgi:hypothetical protein
VKEAKEQLRRQQTEEKASKEAEEKARKEAEEKARKEAEEKASKQKEVEDNTRKKKEAEEQARKRKEAEEYEQQRQEQQRKQRDEQQRVQQVQQQQHQERVQQQYQQQQENARKRQEAEEQAMKKAEDGDGGSGSSGGTAISNIPYHRLPALVFEHRSSSNKDKLTRAIHTSLGSPKKGCSLEAIKGWIGKNCEKRILQHPSGAGSAAIVEWSMKPAGGTGEGMAKGGADSSISGERKRKRKDETGSGGSSRLDTPVSVAGQVKSIDNRPYMICIMH